MPASMRTSSIRDYIGNRLIALGASPDQNLMESLLLRDGVYCGHRFQRGDWQAVWFVEEAEIKFFLDDGSLAQKIQTSQIPEPPIERQAA